MTDKITIEIPAPLPQSMSPLEFFEWGKAVYAIATEAVNKQEPRELVRFFYCKDNCGVGSVRRDSIFAQDDCGNLLYWYPYSDIDTPDLAVGSSCKGEEIHPRLTIRRRDPNVEGEWVCEDAEKIGMYYPRETYPCDQNGNPLENDSPPVKSWVREGDYWLAPIEWSVGGPRVNGANMREGFVAPTHDGQARCVGFLRLDELEELESTYPQKATWEAIENNSVKAATRPYPCLLDWQATHAVMKKEGE